MVNNTVNTSDVYIIQVLDSSLPTACNPCKGTCQKDQHRGGFFICHFTDKIAYNFVAQNGELVLRRHLLIDPDGEEGGESLEFVLREAHGVVVGVVQDTKAFALRTGGRNVTGSL